jgi:hypothetical protein
VSGDFGGGVKSRGVGLAQVCARSFARLKNGCAQDFAHKRIARPSASALGFELRSRDSRGGCPHTKNLLPFYLSFFRKFQGDELRDAMAGVRQGVAVVGGEPLHFAGMARDARRGGDTGVGLGLK